MIPNTYNVKITVLRRMVNEDLIREYASDTDVQTAAGLSADEMWMKCPVMKEGQEFIVPLAERDYYFVDRDLVPKDFCLSAWAAIQKEVAILSLGGRPVWMEKGDDRHGVIIACCTDGLRPVVFKLESVEPDHAS
jgi:uncharacterized repeat protein (TIGR04076 family)